jgi:hypothetical protein
MIFKPRTISKLAIVPPAARSERANLAICLIVKNEAFHIREWAIFHKHAGVQHFFVYDNGCDDGTLDALADALPDDAFTIMPWDQKLSDGRSGAEIHNQVLAYAHCMRNFGGGYRWMAFIDVDEFLIPTNNSDLPSALVPLENFAHISLPWHMFGRNDFEYAPDGGVVQNYRYRAREPQAAKNALNWKCIVDPTHVTGVRVHGFEVDGRSEGVNDVGLLAKHADRGGSAFYSRDAIQLNHYYTRSKAELQAKIDRGSNKTVSSQKHIKRVMRIVDEIETDTVIDDTAIEYLKKFSK